MDKYQRVSDLMDMDIVPGSAFTYDPAQRDADEQAEKRKGVLPGMVTQIKSMEKVIQQKEEEQKRNMILCFAAGLIIGFLLFKAMK